MDVDSVEEMIREAYKQQKHTKCLELINAAPENVGISSQYKILKASCLNNIAGKSDDAHKVLDEVIKSEPKNAFAFYGKGLVFINESKLSEAVKCFEEAISIDPTEKMNKARQMKTRTENMMKTAAKVKLETKPEHGKFKHCHYCKKDFSKSFSLSRHLLLHTGDKPHKCPTCGYGFIQKSDLCRHLATHSDKFDFKCQDCGKLFKTKKNLHCHLSTHSDVWPYKCKFCPKSFKLPRLLKHHEQNHLKSHDFGCETCGKQFPSNYFLSRHHKRCRQQAVKTKRALNLKLAAVERKPAAESPRHQEVEVEELDDALQYEPKAGNIKAKTESEKKLIAEVKIDNNDKIMLHSGKSKPEEVESLLVEIKSEISVEPAEFKRETTVKKVQPKFENQLDSPTTIKGEELTFDDLHSKGDDGSDLAFCMSLLKDISQMSEDKKAYFKRRILATLDDIRY